MILIKHSGILRKYLQEKRENGFRYGFVPTMGALHQGHVSLILQSMEENDLTVSSIFVNPAQFNDRSDFENYPESIADDILALETAGCDVLFLPSVKEIYPEGFENLPQFDLGYLEMILEGEFRPGHFQGVCSVVHRLLETVQPDQLYLGQKDFQQCMVIARLLEITGKNDEINLRLSPTLREPDGLAMSSRNRRLAKEERLRAPEIFRTLTEMAGRLKKDSFGDIMENARQHLEEQGFRVDYIEIRGTDLLQVKSWNGSKPLVLLAAAYLNDVRLIDNLVVD